MVHWLLCFYHVIYALGANLHYVIAQMSKNSLLETSDTSWNLSNCNGIRTHSYLIRKRSFNHSTKLAQFLSHVRITLVYSRVFITCLFRSRLPWHSGNYRVKVPPKRAYRFFAVNYSKFFTTGFQKNTSARQMNWRTLESSQILSRCLEIVILTSRSKCLLFFDW